MTEPEINEEIELIVRAARSTQFRFIVVQYNHLSLIQRVRETLEKTYSDRPATEFRLQPGNLSNLSGNILAQKSGFVFLYDFEVLLSDEPAARVLNQQRDKLSAFPIVLIAFLPSGKRWLQECVVKMPDLWSLRTLISDLQVEHGEDDMKGIFEQPTAMRFSDLSLSAKYAEIENLKARLEEIENSSENLNYRSTILSNLGEIHYSIGRYEEAYKFFEQSLKIQQEIGNRMGQSSILNNIGQIYNAQGDYSVALIYLEQSLKITQEIGDRHGEGITLNNISQIYNAQGDYSVALSLLQRSLKIQQEIGDRQGVGNTLNTLATTAHAQGDYTKALSFLEQSLKIQQEIGDRQGMGTTLNNLAAIAHAQGDYTKALSFLEQSLKIQQEIGDRQGMGNTLNNLGLNYRRKGENALALKYYQQSLKIRQEIGDISGVANALHNMGCINFEQENWEHTINCFFQAHQILKQIGSPDYKYPESWMSIVINRIGEEQYNTILTKIQNQEKAKTNN